MLFKTYVIQDILFKAVQNTATNMNTYSSTRKYQAATVQFHDTNPRIQTNSGYNTRWSTSTNSHSTTVGCYDTCN